MFGHARPAAADVVERVVAVVDHRPVLLSEVEHRARLDLIAEHRTVATPRDLKAALDRIIDERAVERAAVRAQISISPAEVDRAITEEGLARARAIAFSEAEYREMQRVELLDAKLSAIWFARPVQPTAAEVWAAYERLRHDPGRQLDEMEILSLPVVSSASATEAVVRGLIERARAGEDWCTLARLAMAIPACIRTLSFPSGLVPTATRALAGMNEGDISEPIRVDDHEVAAFKLMGRVPPGFEDVRMAAEMEAELDLRARVHREHLNELRREISIDVRW